MSVELINLQSCKMLFDVLAMIVPMFLVTFIAGTLLLKCMIRKCHNVTAK